MKKIIMLIVLLAVLGGGGAAAYLFLLAPAEAAGQEAGEHAKAEEEAHATSSGHGSSDVEFVELDPLILPILDKTGVSQTVSIVVALEVKDSNSADIVRKMTPRLKDAYIQELYGILNHVAARNGGAIKINILKKRLNKMTVKVLGKDVVQDVLLQVVQQRGT